VVADASEQRGLAARWGVDVAALIGRLRDLTPFEKLALVDASERAHFLYRAKLGPIDDEQHDRAAFLHAAWAVGLAEACYYYSGSWQAARQCDQYECYLATNHHDSGS